MKPPSLKTSHLLSIADLSKDEMIALFKFSEQLKKDLKRRKSHKYLSNRSLAMIFEKSSTRTRVSFETGIYQLGGQPLFLSGSDIQIGRGETLSDTAKVLSRYVNGIMIRTFSDEKIAELAQNSDIPVINGLTDKHHPCQALADFFTIYEIEKKFAGIKITYIGDGNNVANSLMLGAAILGMDISIACPVKYNPDKEITEQAKTLAAISGSKIEITKDVDKAVSEANYIYTDVWVSMGQEKESVRKKKDLAKYKISMSLLGKCAPSCRIMHCLPAHRGEEIDSEVMDSKNSIIFEQAENRLHIQKAVMCALMK